MNEVIQPKPPTFTQHEAANHFFARLLDAGKPKQSPGERAMQKTIDDLSASLSEAQRANPINQLSLDELEQVCNWLTHCEIARDIGFSGAVPGLRKIASAANKEWHRRQEGKTTEAA